MDSKKLLQKGDSIILKLNSVIRDINDFPGHYWPKPSEFIADYKEAMDFYSELKELKLSNDLDNLLLHELKTALYSSIVELKVWMLKDGVSTKDHLIALGMEEKEMLYLKNRLEQVDQNEIKEIGYMRFKERSSRWSFGIPLTPKFFNDFDVLFNSSIDTLFNIGRSFFPKSESAYIDKLQGLYSCVYSYSDISKVSFFSKSQNTIFFSLREISYLQGGKPKIDYSRLIPLFAHEVFGHALHQIITEESSNLPEYSKIDTASWCITTNEEISAIFEKEFTNYLTKNHSQLDVLTGSNDNLDLTEKITRDRIYNTYLSDLRAFAFYTIIKNFEKNRDLTSILKEFDKIKLPSPTYLSDFYSSIKTTLNSKGHLSDFHCKYLTRSSHNLEMNNIGVFVNNGERSKLNKKLFTGFWSPFGILKWLEYQNAIKN